MQEMSAGWQACQSIRVANLRCTPSTKNKQTTNQLTFVVTEVFFFFPCSFFCSSSRIASFFLCVQSDAQSVQKVKVFARCLHITPLSGGWPEATQVVVVVVVAVGTQAEPIRSSISLSLTHPLHNSAKNCAPSALPCPGLSCSPLSSTLHAIIAC